LWVIVLNIFIFRSLMKLKLCQNFIASAHTSLLNLMFFFYSSTYPSICSRSLNSPSNACLNQFFDLLHDCWRKFFAGVLTLRSFLIFLKKNALFLFDCFLAHIGKSESHFLLWIVCKKSSISIKENKLKESLLDLKYL
jgi:hypothetical protein